MSEAKKRKLNDLEIMFPILPDDLIEATPLTKVYVDEITDRKNISKVILELNSKLPIPQLIHLKRIKAGKDVILCPADLIPIDEVFNYLNKKHIDSTNLKNNIRIMQVAKIQPKNRKQYDTVNKLWPCNFHTNKYIEKLCTNTLFNEIELDKHVTFMNIAIDVAKYFKKHELTHNPIGIVVFDPQNNSVVALGYDKRKSSIAYHGTMVALNNVAMSQKFMKEVVLSKINSSSTPSANNTSISNEDVSKSVSKSEIAYEDELIIPRESGGFSISHFPICLDFIQAKYPDVHFGLSLLGDHYLCTNYEVYMTHEPCLMCSMALIHSRVKRVFYGRSVPHGGLGSACKIHTIDNLNHHFEVFKGLLVEECNKLY